MHGQGREEICQNSNNVNENNWIRRIVGVIMRLERRRTKDLSDEIVTEACLVGKIVKSRMKWAGHMVRMKDEIIEKI